MLLTDRYRVVGLVGRGGMGEVYRVDDLKLGQEAALKFLPQQLQADPERLERLYGEVRLARQISHPHVCRVHDIGDVEGQPFISMEYVDGENLAVLLRRIGRLPGDKALQIARQLCYGLAAAHDKKVLHRDLKPENVMIDGVGHVRITDFGLAALADAIHGDDLRSGTPAYMSPEQLSGRAVSERSDIYSLGLVLYELFTGRKAFSGRSLTEILKSREATTPASPSTLVADMDPAVERIILKCLDRDPGQRPVTAAAVAAALPGGDPLAAALAAGETPSPELVAAAGERGVISVRAGWACLLTILLGMAGVLLLMPRASLITSIPFEKPTAVLLDRARGALRAVAPAEAPSDDAWGLSYDDDYVQYVAAHDTSVDRWAGLTTGRPAVLFFWYRESPAPLLAVAGLGIVSPTDPPPLLPGMEGVKLDPSGRLIELYAVPPEIQEDGPPVKPDWSLLFAEAGLDASRLVPTPSQWTPPVYADSREAWHGAFPERPDLPIHVEAAAFRGRPVFFRILGAWTRRARERSAEPTAGARVANYIGAALLLAVFVGTVGLARRNVRLGRGDRKGAFRLSAYGFGAGVVVLVLELHHVRDLWGEIDLSSRAIGCLLALSSLIWLLYVAIEPFVRRQWPGRIVAWSRLLSGGFRDPLVGRDVLIGVLWGSLEALLAQCLRLLPGWLSLPPPPPRLVDTDPLLGLRYVIGDLIVHQLGIMAYGLGLLVLFLILRSVLKRDVWVALTLAAIEGGFAAVSLGPGAGAGSTALFFAVGVALAGVALAALLRFGFLAFLVGFWVEVLLVGIPLTPNVGSWYFGLSSAIVLLTFGLAVYGLVTALAGQSLLGGEFLKD